VSTASSTTYELLALGTPIVSIPVTDDQIRLGKALRKRDLATVLEGAVQAETITEAVQEYTIDPEMRRTRKSRGRELVDSKGVERVFSTMVRVQNTEHEQ